MSRSPSEPLCFSTRQILKGPIPMSAAAADAGKVFGAYHVSDEGLRRSALELRRKPAETRTQPKP
ncbi:MAG TPA: hypothetical protein PLF01_06085 [Alphaproteobacteria bacterium]|nr:hypothetical protein [Alphaproteobacteria bacterium]